MTDIHIDIKNKTYVTEDSRQHTAIADLSISLPGNQFICLVGPSGCGKTTLLNIIANLDKQYQGEILLGQQQLQPKIGYIFQSPRLLPWRTVRENIELVLTEQQSPKIIDSLLESMQLTDSQHAYPQHLSLGMSRRVAIIRAFAVNPHILLMDEPFVSLDAPTARQVRNLLIQLW
jgi:NitT/TauT family transport system ATP-binding protein